MTTATRARLRYLALAVATIIVGLWVHRGGALLGRVGRDMTGDALWAVMIFWLVGAAAPHARLALRSAVALGICVVVELGQLIHSPGLDAVRATTMGHLVLGSGFDPRDFLSYAVGVGIAAVLDFSRTTPAR